MDLLPDVEFVKGDFNHDDVVEQILKRVDNRPVDLVISDMAPNMSGISAVDQPRAMALVELAFDFAHQVLTPGGAFLAKVFQGEGSDTLMRDMRKHYGRFVSRKPDASRARSREVYWVGKGFKGF